MESDVEKNYEAFVAFLEAQNKLVDFDYLDRMHRFGHVILAKRSRTLLDIVREIGQGKMVKDWRKSLTRSTVIDEINTLCAKEFGKVHSDLLNINYTLIGSFIPNFPRAPKITNWREAWENNCLKSYFGENDIFHLAEGRDDRFLFEYSNDYFEYVRTFPLAERVRVYRTYLTLNNTEIPIKYNSFGDPKYFVGPSMRQFAEYEDVILRIERKDRDKLYFLGDGVGIGSMICIKNDLPYASSEIGKIGMMAIQLGIITYLENQILGDDYILVLCNVEEYLTDKDLDNYVHKYKRIVVINENRKSKIAPSVDGTHDKLFLKGVAIQGLFVPTPIAKVDDYLRVREPVTPVDLKSKIYAENAGIKIDENGFVISYDNVEGAFNIRTRKYPGNPRYARKGDIKLYKGCKFKYEEEGQMVCAGHEVFRYYPEDPGRSTVLLKGKYREEGDFVVAVVLRPRQIRRYVDQDEIVQPLYYLYSRKVGDKYESYYSKKNVGVAKVVMSEDYVVRDDG